MVDLIWLIYLGASPFFIIPAIVWALGGVTEAHFRISHIPYFAVGIFGPDGSESVTVLRWTEIQRHSPPMFSFNGKMRGIDDRNMGRHHGRPKWYFNWDDLVPLPIMHWHDGSKIDPADIDAAWDNKFLEDMARLGEKKSPLVALLMVVLVVAAISLVIGIAGIYYSHDSLCALKPVSC